PGAFRVLLGHGGLEQLGVVPGEDVTVVLPNGAVTPFGVFPRRKALAVAGRVRTGSQLDDRAAYLHAEDARRLLRLDGAFHGVEARIDEPLRAREVGELARRVAGPDHLVLATWFRTHGPLYRTIQVTKGMMFLIFSLLVAVAAFNLVSSLVMIV
ncbi:MAG: lipoprotein-releasing system transmembrane subunit LolC, partial [Gammaproteobacteria bacterium]|nr:lipoprotein-releasing system transmembrane subunit LolC [Gammaproteobacteria bacterium]